MAILAIAASKGGSGKTTLCLLLADAFARVGMPVAILDADPQASSLQWMRRCEAAGDKPALITVEAAVGEIALSEKLDGAGEYGVVIVDLPGVLNQVVGVGASRADLVIVPMRMSFHDVTEAVKLLKWLKPWSAMRPRERQDRRERCRCDRAKDGGLPRGRPFRGSTRPALLQHRLAFAKRLQGDGSPKRIALDSSSRHGSAGKKRSGISAIS